MCNNMVETHKIEQKMPGIKECVPRDFIYLVFLKDRKKYTTVLKFILMVPFGEVVTQRGPEGDIWVLVMSYFLIWVVVTQMYASVKF